MLKSEFLIIMRSKQIRVFYFILTALFLIEYLVSEVKSAPFFVFNPPPPKSTVSISRSNSVSHKKVILHLHVLIKTHDNYLIYLSQSVRHRSYKEVYKTFTKKKIQETNHTDDNNEAISIPPAPPPIKITLH